ncbi:thiol-disulfide oxidoreductase DCC family protein [Rheinheimera sp. MMS21-TC3]|uniref:thiol-disulfide oxidoreductase DCC family protein n=1 Tax=Rheinheimera sp. MMS21-TC3 TaxID=3072790 RepID=UPI0028C425E6|nr:DCC1-like thiol-disulfide oxidoreductase family protein [Rheinheimera sp. MMS21-TC3]WNO61181.1 DCC1-like thiol-disulfide oxidoreductase family protein [Rheinheimera sp. MMS21-TC3]
MQKQPTNTEPAAPGADKLNLAKLNCHHIVIFDGVCLFCHAAVNFIIKRDKKAVFLFCPMQTQLATDLMQQYKVKPASSDTIYLFKQGQCYTYSSAALEISKSLSGLWFILTILALLPKSWRDYGYKAFAKRRYQWFGKAEQCILPTTDTKSRFIGL